MTKEELGGPAVAVDSGGVVHNVVADDGAAIALARRYLSHFPTQRLGRHHPGADGPDTGPPAARPPRPDPARPPPALSDPTGARGELVDDGELLEVQPGFGRSIVTALAHLGGRSVAIVANDPSVLAGTIDSDAADKAAHFLDVADAFGLPCVFLADNPGVLAGTAAEGQGILRHAARLFAVQHRMRVPKLHVTLRKAFGFGSSVMAMNPFDGQTVTLALPSITLGALPAASAASAIDDPDERARVAAEQSEASVRAAARLSYDDVVDPRDLRDALLAGLDLAEGRDTGATAAPRRSASCPDRRRRARAAASTGLRSVRPAGAACRPTPAPSTAITWPETNRATGLHRNRAR